MSEKYIGTKFTTNFLSRQLRQHSQISELKKWCRLFAQKGLSPALPGCGFGGNLSFRVSNSFIITATGANLQDISASQLVFVKKIRGNTVFVEGSQQPSSEAILHYALYTKRPQINAIFHGHHLLNSKLIYQYNIPTTARQQPYGSYAQVKEVLKICNEHNILLIKQHGFISMANSMNSAGQQILDIIDKE
jgi:L-fuculose-phosphate aldolase